MSATDNLKRCGACKQRKPIRDFASKYAKRCNECRARAGQPLIDMHQLATMEQWGAQTAQVLRDGEQRRAHLQHLFKGSRYQLQLKYNREIKRAAKAGTPRKNQPTGKPRTCRRCHRVLGSWAFRDPYVRICATCDGPEMIDPRLQPMKKKWWKG